jgi:hypothetical protein
MKTIIQIIVASILSVAAPTFAHAAYLQSHAAYQQSAVAGWGNASTPGASFGKDDTFGVTSKATRAVRGLDARAYAPTALVGWGNASTPGASFGKDDTIPSGR